MAETPEANDAPTAPVIPTETVADPQHGCVDFNALHDAAKAAEAADKRQARAPEKKDAE